MPPDRLVRPASSPGVPTQAAAHPEVRVKPRLRGVFHQYAFFASLASGTLLVLLAATTRALVAAAVYAASVSALFGVSALYHRVTWTTSARRRMRRLDHAMIFLLIAGTYTPVGLLVLHGTLGAVVLAVVWGGALVGIVLQLTWTTAPRWLGGTVYLALGWVAVAAMPQLFARLGVAGGLLVVVGGLVYSAGRPCMPCAAPTRYRPSSATTRSSTFWSSPGSPPTSWPSACSRCPPAERAGLRALWLSSSAASDTSAWELDRTCVDTHRGTLAAAAPSLVGGVLAQTAVRADAAGHQALLSFADAHVAGRPGHRRTVARWRGAVQGGVRLTHRSACPA
jgi:hemolysin III